MSKRAEEAAWNWASKNKLDPYSMGRAFGEGYEQAEKDLELTWEDIKDIACLLDEVVGENTTIKQDCEEVLRRFNETRK